MNEENSQPDFHGGLEAENNPVAERLGLLDQASLSDLLKSNFLNEEEAAPALEEQQEEEESPEPSSEDIQDDSDDSEQSDTVEESSLNKGVQKRINKLVAARKAAESQLEEQKAKLSKLESELETARNSVPQQETEVSDFVQTLDTPEKVQQEYKRSVEVLIWCERNANGGHIPYKGEDVYLDSDQVAEMKAEALRRKELELPDRLQYLNALTQHETQAQKDFNWWSKPETEEYKTAQMVLKEFPALKKRPDYKHIAGLVVLGVKEYNKMQSSKIVKPSQPIKKAPPQPSSKGIPPRTSGDDLRSAKQKFASANSDRNAVTDYVKAMGFA
jgi:hypothetical protein